MDEYQRALDEYTEICAYHRTEDQLKWQVLGIAYGGAAVLAVNAVGSRYSFASLALGAAAAVAATLGTAVYSRLSLYTKWRLERAWQLEEKPLGFRHHLHLKEKGDTAKNRVNPIVRLGYWAPWLIWVAFAVATVLKRHS